MFLYLESIAWKKTYKTTDTLNRWYSSLQKNNYRKAKFSLPPNCARRRGTGTFFFAPLRGSLTVEAAVAVPLFLFVMIAVLQYGAVMGTAARFGAALSEAGKSIATASYAVKYGGDLSEVPEIAAVALTEAYAQGKVMNQTGDTSAVRNANMLLSSFLKNDNTIDLVLTYQLRSPVNIAVLPQNFFIQRARVRAWTGRAGSGGNDTSEGEEVQTEYVYVTETGTVYHDDPDCTYLNPSVRAVNADRLSTLRNRGGAIYHRCELCGEANPAGTVYITRDGTRYHSSVSCSGLKRTVRQVSKEELGDMHACSKCGKE